MRTLIHAQIVYAPGYPDADSLLIEDGIITWVGQYSAVAHLNLSFDRVVDIPEYFVAPAFVDSHVHLSATGALLTGLDLRNATSANQAIEMLRDYVALSSEDFIVGHGWEDTNWIDSEDWNFQSINEIVGNRHLYLSRIDVHSALVSTPNHQGIVKTDEHHEVRKFVQDNLPKELRRKQIFAALNFAAQKGVVSVHENGGPAVSGSADFLDVLEISKNVNLPQVFGYWGDTDLAVVKQLGAFGAAGDLTVDGSIGSFTAKLSESYVGTDEIGTQFLSVDQIASHLINCTHAGIQGGFHAIGDGALDAVISGLRIAEEKCGTAAIRTARHRIEHAEMLNTSHLEYLSSLGVVLSMQPIFDECWGNPDGLYEQRLGANRAAQMNTFAAIASSGVTMAFSSDSPVTPIDPWRTVKAAMMHHTPTHRISARAAFTAHTRGGWRAVKDDLAGVIAEGAPAHIAIWSVGQYAVTVPDDRVRAWSTDVRSGTPLLPDLEDSSPVCIATLRSGLAIFDSQKIFADV
ncbi:MAG: hypothetical protein RIR66_818 [Actinomycetota bacterium]